MPDLITIAYGMNDQNSLGNAPGSSEKSYICNIKEAVEGIRACPGNAPEIILLTSMPANPIWNYTSGGSAALAKALRQYAGRAELPLADANALFRSELEHGKSFEELIISLINHPGDYGHYLYYLTLRSLLEEALNKMEQQTECYEKQR